MSNSSSVLSFSSNLLALISTSAHASFQVDVAYKSKHSKLDALPSNLLSDDEEKVDDEDDKLSC